MMSWKQRRQERDIAALKMSVTADSAVSKWVEEFCDILDDGVCGAKASTEEKVDRSAARDNRFASLISAYPFKSSPWTHVVTKHYLLERPSVGGEPVCAGDVVDWVCGCSRAAVARESAGEKRSSSTRRREVRDAAKTWLTSAEGHIESLRAAGKGRLLSYDRAGAPYRARQNEIHEMRRISPLLTDAEIEFLLRQACDRYMNGHKPRNAGEVVELLRRAAVDGDSRVQRRLGLAQIAGDRVKRRSREGLMWLHRAASDGNAAARFDLGKLYASGRVVGRNRTIAFAWLRLASGAGHDKARILANALSGDLTDRQKRVACRLADQYESSGSASAAFA